MKRVALLSVGLLLAMKSVAQIPYFAGTVGDGKLYGYTSVKVRPGINHQETYTTFQYGLGSHFAAGLDLYTLGTRSSSPSPAPTGIAYWGTLIRYGLTVSKWFNIGAEATSSFNLNDNFKFSYLTSALYLNGAITANQRLFWCSNTWWGVNKGSSNTFRNYEYLGYTIPLRHGQALTPMAGAIHSWKFDEDTDVAAGFYYTLKNWNFYLWGNDFLKSHPRLVVGIDFAL